MLQNMKKFIPKLLKIIASVVSVGVLAAVKVACPTLTIVKVNATDALL